MGTMTPITVDLNMTSFFKIYSQFLILLHFTVHIIQVGTLQENCKITGIYMNLICTEREVCYM